tara:strand:+ start:788 stop:952 length:165 start_codon:yes stop_codon:yes gene_type:complete
VGTCCGQAHREERDGFVLLAARHLQIGAFLQLLEEQRGHEARKQTYLRWCRNQP